MTENGKLERKWKGCFRAYLRMNEFEQESSHSRTNSVQTNLLSMKQEY